jgi:hypothetical protein
MTDAQRHDRDNNFKHIPPCDRKLVLASSVLSDEGPITDQFLLEGACRSINIIAKRRGPKCGSAALLSLTGAETDSLRAIGRVSYHVRKCWVPFLHPGRQVSSGGWLIGAQKLVINMRVSTNVSSVNSRKINT